MTEEVALSGLILCHVEVRKRAGTRERQAGHRESASITLKPVVIMAKKKKPNHQADIKNPNKGSDGTNTTNAKVHGNLRKQLNPSQKDKP